jgi:two-component system NtrC family sensor kinase
MDFMPHGHCILWNPFLLWSMVFGNTAIFGSYMWISYKLYRLNKKAGALFAGNDFNVLWWFAAFIVACGFTHFMDVVTMWEAWWYASVAITYICAFASLKTAFALPSLIASKIGIIDALNSKLVKAREEAQEKKITPDMTTQVLEALIRNKIEA